MAVNFEDHINDEEYVKQKFLDVSRADITPDEVMEHYKKWAKYFDKDLSVLDPTSTSTSISRTSIIKCAEKVLGTNKQAKILDIGSATGIIGSMLKKLGYTQIDGLDCCEAMNQKAMSTNAYRHIYCDFLGKNKLNIEQDTYDVIIGHGILIPGHANEECFDELLRIIKPGGFFVLCLGNQYSTDAPDHFKNITNGIKELQEEGKWKVIESTLVQNAFAEQSCSNYTIQIQ